MTEAEVRLKIAVHVLKYGFQCISELQQRFYQKHWFICWKMRNIHLKHLTIT